MATLPELFFRRVRLLALPILVLGWMPGAARAQDVDTLTRSRLDVLVTAAPETPTGDGLLGTAVAEAGTAFAQAVTAHQVSGDLRIMQRAAEGVLHAVDPTLVASGPGLGYGVRRALTAAVTQIEATAVMDRKSDVAYVAPRALALANATAVTLDALVDVAQQLRTTASVEDAAPLAARMRALASEVLVGPREPSEPTGRPGPAGGLYGMRARLVPLLLMRGGDVPADMRTLERRP